MKPPTPTITRLTLKQYKSIEDCDFSLGALTVLVGRNGVGKSNILDSLSLVTDALQSTLEYALLRRRGIAQVRRKSPSKPTIPVIEVAINLPDGGTAQYGFAIETIQGPLFRVKRERCIVRSPDGRIHRFATADGTSREWSPATPGPAVSPDRLHLVAASGLPEFRAVYDVLTRMVFHNLNPEAMKAPRLPEPGSLLARDGSNLAGVIKQLTVSAPHKLERVLKFIQAIGVPIQAITHKQVSSYETFEVLQERGEGNRPSNFEASALSDGTIRALGILVSLVSVGADGVRTPSLIGIEEPETALHPAAAGALMEALMEGSESAQVIVTCHSPDLLDHPDLTADVLRAVVIQEGGTKIGPIAPGKTRLLREHLVTAGELLRLDQLEPDPEDLRRQAERKDTLWETPA